MVRPFHGVLSVKAKVLCPDAFVLVEVVLGVEVAVDGEGLGPELLDDVASRERD